MLIRIFLEQGHVDRLAAVDHRREQVVHFGVLADEGGQFIDCGWNRLQNEPGNGAGVRVDRGDGRFLGVVRIFRNLIQLVTDTGARIAQIGSYLELEDDTAARIGTFAREFS